MLRDTSQHIWNTGRKWIWIRSLQVLIRNRIVGEDDGGKLLSEEEYAKYRERAIIARKNRIYVNYRCMSTGMDCKVIGPQSKCFCGHKYQQHATDNYQDKNIHCKAKDCKCKLFESIPSRMFTLFMLAYEGACGVR